MGVAVVGHVVARRLQPAINHVEHDHHPGMAEMAIIVDGHAADIHADLAFDARFEDFFLTRQGVVDFQHEETFFDN